MSLDLVHAGLGWPERNAILEPSGGGPRMYAQLARAKLGEAIARHPDARDAQVGILAPNPASPASDSPLAVVCEFQRPVSDQTLRDLQKLAWNFSRSPALVTVEPHRLRAWTCCEPPEDDRSIDAFVVKEVPENALREFRNREPAFAAAQALHWVNLVSGQFFRENEQRFQRDQRADTTLLENLREVRKRLRDEGLSSDDICHDLLARVIFIQFLFDRKDSSGRAALNAVKLESLREAGVLKAKHDSFASILADYEEAYRLFTWLDERFNGDLFTGKGDTPAERERAWLAEQRHVKSRHLNLLEQFVSGKLDMPSGQRCLWPQYSFDAIPLEFISSIYEAFVSERARTSGIYYTPPQLVDFMLDRVLPWGDAQWDLKVLDPACGSGVFLVKTFQRLIHRWKLAHDGEAPKADVLRGLLENNIFGVDKDPHAVRVASFSLYLAMCDEIDPKHYWTQVRFPPMRERRLIHADFFEEKRAGFSTGADAATYDLVVGNAPWGERLLTDEARNWARNTAHEWPVVNKGIGLLFLPKAAALAKPDGKITMIQSASSLLFNRSGRAKEFRKQFFTQFQVDEVVNLSALRFSVFNKKKGPAQKSVAPACVVSLRPTRPTGERVCYISPKQADLAGDEFQIVVEPDDVKQIHPEDGATDEEIWAALMWGNRRDWAFIQRLRRLASLAHHVESRAVLIREGIIFGNRKKVHDEIRGRRILAAEDFPPRTFLHLDADRLPILEDPRAHSRDSTDFRAFASPQLVVKQGWQKEVGRFRAELVRSSSSQGVLCTQSYITVHSPNGSQEVLEGACLSYNSILAVYFLLLTSSRFASYRPEPLVEELLRVPIPEPRPGLLKGIAKPSDVDARVREAFGFKDAEWVLVEDLFRVTLADFKGDADSPGRRPTHRQDDSGEEPELRQYCEYFTRVLKTGFGQSRSIAATLFQEATRPFLPFRLVAFEIGSRETQPLRVEPLDSAELLGELEKLNRTWLATRHDNPGGLYFKRVARVYDHRGRVPTIYIIKPDARRYWTRSIGLHDADEVAADFMSWQAATEAGPGSKRGTRG